MVWRNRRFRARTIKANNMINNKRQNVFVKTIPWILLHVSLLGVVSGAPSASPVLSAVSDTARFSWEIPQGGLGPGNSFYAVSPAGVTVFLVTGTGTFLPTGNYTGRVVYQGNIAARNVTFTLNNIQTSDAGTYTCGAGGTTTVIQNCGQKLVVLAVKHAVHDQLTVAKLEAFVSVAGLLEPYLKTFQSDAPMLPFIAHDPKCLLKSLMERFRNMPALNLQRPLYN